MGFSVFENGSQSLCQHTESEIEYTEYRIYMDIDVLWQ